MVNDADQAAELAVGDNGIALDSCSSGILTALEQIIDSACSSDPKSYPKYANNKRLT